ADVDDAAAALAPHDRDDRVHGVQRAPEVGRHGAGVVVRLEVIERRDQHDAGAVDQDVDAAGVGGDLLDDLVHGAGPAGVGGDGQRVAAALGEELGVGALEVAGGAGDEGELGALVGELPRELEPEPARAAGDD